MVTIPSAGKLPPPEPRSEPPPDIPQFIPRCCIYCEIVISFEPASKTWSITHKRENQPDSVRTFHDTKIEEAEAWLESLHP